MIPNFTPAIPEIFLLIMGCVALLSGIFIKRYGALVSYWLVEFSLIIATVLVLLNIGNNPSLTFANMFILDNFAILIKTVILLTTFLVFLYSRDYIHSRVEGYQTEYYALGLFAVIGMLVLASAYNLLTVFLGLELFALPVYAMVAMRREVQTCTEAAMKYFVIGSIATGIMLYGFSMIYGATKSLDIQYYCTCGCSNPYSATINSCLWFSICNGRNWF